MKRKISEYSIIYTNESNEIHQEGYKPSLIIFSGFIYFYKNDKWYRKGKPVIINRDGTLEYYEDYKFVKKC